MLIIPLDVLRWLYTLEKASGAYTEYSWEHGQILELVLGRVLLWPWGLFVHGRFISGLFVHRTVCSVIVENAWYKQLSG